MGGYAKKRMRYKEIDMMKGMDLTYKSVLNSTHKTFIYFIRIMLKDKKIQQIAFNLESNILLISYNKNKDSNNWYEIQFEKDDY